MTNKTPNMPVAGEVIITTRSQIVKAYAEWVKQWEAAAEDERMTYDDENYAEAAADHFIKLLHSVK